MALLFLFRWFIREKHLNPFEGRIQIEISICILHPGQDAVLECMLEGISPRSISGRVLTSTKITDHNTFFRPDTVKLEGIRVNGSPLRAIVPAKSGLILAVRQSTSIKETGENDA